MSRPYIPPAKVAYGCPHCVGMETRSCCQCSGTRLVSELVQRHNVSWVWEHGDCKCSACCILRVQRVALTPAKPKVLTKQEQTYQDRLARDRVAETSSFRGAAFRALFDRQPREAGL